MLFDSRAIDIHQNLTITRIFAGLSNDFFSTFYEDHLVGKWNRFHIHEFKNIKKLESKQVLYRLTECWQLQTKDNKILTKFITGFVCLYVITQSSIF